MEGTAPWPCQRVCPCPAAPPVSALWASLGSTARRPRTPRVTPTTPAPTRASAACCPLTSTSASVPEDGQDCGVSVKTAVCPAPVPTAVHAPLCPVAASPAHVLQGTRASAASMTQMNVPPHPPYVKMKDNASTPLVPTSACVLRALLAETVRAPTSPAHLHHA